MIDQGKIDEARFRAESDRSLERVKQSLIVAEEDGGFEVEEKNGVLNVIFEDDSRFVFSPNTPVRQIWISALSTSFKLDWSDAVSDFVLLKTGEAMLPLVQRLVREATGDEAVTLA